MSEDWPGTAEAAPAEQWPGTPASSQPSSNLAAANAALNLTPQEQALYQRHLTNLSGPGGVDNPDGSRSTLFQMSVEHNGKTYNVPTVWDGKILKPDNAIKRVQSEGWDKFPSYGSEDEAEARYGKMHDFMERDTAAYFDSRRPELPISGPNGWAAPTPNPDAQSGIMHAFGEGFGEAMGTERFGFSDATQKWVSGFKDKSAFLAPFQGFMEGIVAPAAAGLDATWRLTQGLYRGTQAVGIEAGLPRDVVSIPDAFMGSPGHAVTAPKAVTRITGGLADKPDLRVAKDMDVIGPERPSISEGTPAEAARAAVPPITAYHGSPYSFDAFDNGKIGTGEGAQSYGHGLYFAEKPDVAKGYKDRLADTDSTARGAGSLYQVRIHADVDRFLDWDKPLSEQSPEVRAAFEKAAGQLKKSGLFTFEPERTNRETRQERLRNPSIPAGDAYQILARGFAESDGFDKAGASQALHEAGIPGIKYLDQGSRAFADGDAAAARSKQIERALRESPSDGTPEGDARVARLRQEIANLENPTRNFVVFDHNDVEITHKNGEPVKPPAPPEQPPQPPGGKGGEPTGQTPWKDRFDEFVGKLKTSDDVKSLIIKAAEEGDEFQAARAGDIPLGQAEKLSEATGIATQDLDLAGMGRLMKNDAQVRTAMQVMIKTNDDLHFAMQKVAAKGGVDDLAELAEMQEARMRRSLAVEQIAGLRAEWGRTGNVFQEFTEASKDTRAFNEFLKDKKGESIDDLRDMAKGGAALDPRTELPRVLNDARREPPGPIYWTWVQGLISGMITHTKYLGANELYALTERGVVTPLAALIGKAKELGGADMDRVFFGETAAGMYGHIAAVPTSFMAAARSVKSGMRMPLDSEVALRQAAIERGEKVPKAIERAVRSGEIPQERPIPGVWGRIIGAPGDVAGGIHTFFKILGERASIEAQAYRGAAKEGLSPTGDAFWQRRADLAANPTEAMRKSAVDDAYKDTFMQELGPRGKDWGRLTKGNPILKWIFPFAHIPINLMKATYEATPFAFADSAMRENLLGRNGGVAQDKAIARMVVGSSIMTYFTYQAMSGKATGDYPDDPKERDQWKLAGKEPNSVLIGNYWMSYNKFGPAGDLANIGANIAAVVARASKMDDDAMTGATWKAAEAAGHLVADEVGFQSLSNLFEAMRDEKKGVAWAASTASSFLPFSSLVSQTASLTDPYMREAKTFTDGLKYRIPGERETLTPKRDWSGQPIANPGYGGGPALGIVRARQVNTDPVDQEMGRLGIHPAPPQDRIGGVKLPPALYDKYQSTAGPFTRAALERIVAQPGWANAPAYVREEVFRKTIAATRQSAAAAMQMAYPQLIQQGVEAKVNRLAGKP